MTKRTLFPKRDVSDTDSDIVYFKDMDISTVAEIIVDDIRSVKLDSEEKVNNVKARVAEILRLIKWGSRENVLSSSDRDLEELHSSIGYNMRKSVSNIYRKAKLDVAVIGLHDKAVTEETKHDINRQVIDEGLVRLKDKTENELRRIDDQTKTLTSAAKSAVQECLKIDMPQGWGRSSVESRQCCPTVNPTIAEYDAQTRKLIEKAKHNIRENVQVLLTNPTGKKLKEEIQSEKFTTNHIVKLQRKFQEDLNNQKVILDQTVKNVKDKTEKLLPFKYYYDGEDD